MKSRVKNLNFTSSLSWAQDAFTLEGRKLIMEKIIEAQELTGYLLIEEEEIRKLWNIDLENPNYAENKMLC